MRDSAQIKRVSFFDEMELERLQKARDAGMVLAVPAAMAYCLEHDLAAPPWLVKSAFELLCDLLRREKSKNRGRSAGSVARYRQDMVDFIRWNEVLVLQENQQRSIELMRTYPACPSRDRTDIYAQEKAKAEWLGTSLEQIYECVSEVLEKTGASGGAESIKRSHREVRRNFRNPSQAYRYYQLHPLFLRKMGIEDDLGYGRHAKIHPWRTSPLRTHKPSVRKRTTVSCAT
jgi:hypothetical protein